MLAINNLSYFIGGRALYENAFLHVKPKDKIGLIGLNGTGKSTLLRLINEEFTPDEGEISKSRDCTLGFLNQDLLSFESDQNILQVAMQAFKEALEVQEKIDRILKEMEENYQEKQVEHLTKLQEKFEVLDGYSLQSKAEEILEGIGFKTEDLTRPFSEFSGGWRMRVMLAKLLLEKPSLLMLDEPTNHLDLPSIEWIENYLRSYEGAVIVVSHDREFLDNVITKTVEVTQQKLILYSGNYAFYLEEKELRNEIQQNAFENQQQKIKQTERFVDRFRAKASKARQVQSKIKSLERLDRIEEVSREAAAINFQFNFKQKSGKFISHLENVSKAYGDLEIFSHSHAAIERGDKIALIGANGKGKSTLLRIVAGTESYKGEIRPGYNVIQSFYAQHQLEALHVNNEILEELKQSGSDKTEQELRGVLGCFLFSGDDVFKKIKVLSGGEKSRVALAKTLISDSNFLILDEPTNHLDFISENILIQALQQYEGTFVIVSHNRHFISEVANKIWYIEDKEIKEYPGTYDEFNYWQSRQKEEMAASELQQKKPKVQKEKPRPQDQDRLKKIKKELSRIEESMETTEIKISELEATMGKEENFSDTEKLHSLNSIYHAEKENLEKLNQQWGQLIETITELEKTQPTS